MYKRQVYLFGSLALSQVSVVVALGYRGIAFLRSGECQGLGSLVYRLFYHSVFYRRLLFLDRSIIRTPGSVLGNVVSGGRLLEVDAGEAGCLYRFWGTDYRVVVQRDRELFDGNCCATERYIFNALDAIIRGQFLVFYSIQLPRHHADTCDTLVLLVFTIFYFTPHPMVGKRVVSPLVGGVCLDYLVEYTGYKCRTLVECQHLSAYLLVDFTVVVHDLSIHDCCCHFISKCHSFQWRPTAFVS